MDLNELMMDVLTENKEVKAQFKEKIKKAIEEVDVKKLSKAIEKELMDSIQSFDYCEILSDPFDKMMNEAMDNISAKVELVAREKPVKAKTNGR
jgi:hypothetical protein